LRERRSPKLNEGTNINALVITGVLLLVALIVFVLAGVPPWGHSVALAAGLVISAAGLVFVDLATTSLLVAGYPLRAAAIYVGSTAAFLCVTIAVLVTADPRLLVLMSIPTLVVLVPVVRNADLSALSHPEMRDRVRFGATQTAILVFSGAIPLVMHLSLPALGLDLKMSKLISTFTAIAGVAMFFSGAVVMARSPEIAVQAPALARDGANRFAAKIAFLYFPFIPVAYVAAQIILGSATWLFGICSWLFLISQLTVTYCRYLCFANKSLGVDLAANFLPFAIVMTALFVIRQQAAVAQAAVLPLVVLCTMPLLSALIYMVAVNTGLVFKGASK
jgi:hypothetical protein